MCSFISIFFYYFFNSCKVTSTVNSLKETERKEDRGKQHVSDGSTVVKVLYKSCMVSF